MRKYLQRGLVGPAYGPRAPRPRRLEPYEAYLRERIEACAGLSGRRLYRELRVLGYRGGYTAVTDYLRRIRPALPPPFERRFATEPGRQAQVDFAEFLIKFADQPGVRHRVLNSPPMNWSSRNVSVERVWTCPQRWTTCSEKIAADGHAPNVGPLAARRSRLMDMPPTLDHLQRENRG